MRTLAALGLMVSLGWACQTAASGDDVEDGGSADASATDGTFGDGGLLDSNAADADSADSDAADANVVDANVVDGSAGDASFAIPPLGVYTVNTDGGGLQLLVDAGANELSHVRGSSSGWLVATRYGQDPDNNGLAMENETGFGAFYEGSQIRVFARSAPYAQTVISGAVDGGVSANASWTADGKVIYLASAPGAPLSSAHLERASFVTVPVVSSVAIIPVPSTLSVPVDPHQIGLSDGTGTISFSASVNLSAKWLRPVWKMPATGTSSMGAVSFVGCPICPLENGCCSWTNIADVLGTNDSRFSHSGGDIMWMQQHPAIAATVGTITFNPFRQSIRPLDGGAQVDLVAPGTAATTSLTFGEWRPDDQELVYWSIELEGNTLRQHLWLMNPDGSNRRMIPLPPSLCPLHPSYLSSGEIVFNAWRGAAPDGSCDVSRL